MNNMRLIFASLFAAFTVALTGCKTQVVDCRGPVDVCEIHHAYMHTEIVKNRHLPLPSQEYVMARAHGFIHAEPFLLPEGAKKCAVYICDDCVRAEEQWKAQHGQ